MVKFSVVVPLYNEEENIKPLFSEISRSMDSLGSYELIFVNDGSTDRSLDEILALDKPNIKVINLRKNYGQSPALDVGLKASKGEFVVTLDSDLQNDPKDIPNMFDKLIRNNLDVVTGWRKKRKDPLWMIIGSRVANSLRSFFLKDKFHDYGCTLRVYRRDAIEDLDINGEMHRYIVALLDWKGAKVGEIKVNHRPRIHGITKYTWKKYFNGFVDLMYVWFWKHYSNRPLHFFGSLGLFVIFLGFLSFCWGLYSRFILNRLFVDSFWFFGGLLSIFFGMTMFTFGILFDLMIRTYYNSSDVEDKYTISSISVGGEKIKK